MRVPRVPRTLVTSQHQPREVEVGLEDKESLWAPFGHHPHTHQVGAGVGWKLLRQARTPSFVGRGAGKRAEEEAASFSLGRCLHPSHELALGFAACSPARCARRRSWLAAARPPSAFDALARLDLGTKRHSWGR